MILFTLLSYLITLQQIMLSRACLFILIIPLCLTANSCQNNATYSKELDFCSCPVGFIGKNCNVRAYQLNETELTVPITTNYSFVYFNPPEKVFYHFLLTACSAIKSQQMNIIIFAQQEQKNGQIQLLPRKSGQFDQVTIGGSKGCKQELSTILVNIDKKPNQELMRIIFGFKLSNQSADLKDQNITIKCEISSILNVNFLAIILTSFFAIVGLFLLLSIVFLIRKKWIQRRAQQEEQTKKIQCVNSIMPSTKYANLIEQRPEKTDQRDQWDVVCSICLCEFEINEEVRKTPCGHIYHSGCIQSWCNSHLTCPICRKNFEQAQEIELVEEALQPDTTNIRAPIL